MSDDDAIQVAAKLDTVWLMKGQTIGTPQKMAIVDALAPYPVGSVLLALDAHVRDPERGRFLPTPADVVAQLDRMIRQDGRPGADEAWSTAVRACDESETVVWTDETARAWTQVKPLFERGDEIGARVGFREAYNRMVDNARGRRVAVSWQVSEGFDRERRVLAIERAARAGQLPELEATALLQIAGPAPVNGLGDLMSRPDVPDHARQAFDRFKQRVAEKANQAGADAVEKERTRALKEAAARKVADALRKDDHG